MKENLLHHRQERSPSSAGMHWSPRGDPEGGDGQDNPLLPHRTTKEGMAPHRTKGGMEPHRRKEGMEPHRRKGEMGLDGDEVESDSDYHSRVRPN